VKPGGVGVLSELAETSTGIKSLLVTFPSYARQWWQLLTSPIRSFRVPQAAADGELRARIAFLLQGLIIGFIVLTMGRALPQSIATFSASNLPLVSGSAADVRRYAQRVDAVGQALPRDLTSSWFRQGELMLAVRVLPEERFTVLLARLRGLAEENQDLLARAIDGSLAGPERFGGRGYLLSFFGALNPRTGPLLYQTYRITGAGPRYELPPYVDFLLRSVLVWLLVCAVITWLLPAQPADIDTRTVFAVGALLWGFLAPLYELVHTLLRFYLAATLPAFVPAAAQLMSESAPPSLVALSGGVFPYENLGLVAVQAGVALGLSLYALTALAVGLRAGFHVSTARAVAATAIGLGVGLGLTELTARIVVLVLAPTGLL
jgi:hypothetical protein